jgi:hypothetical protein
MMRMMDNPSFSSGGAPFLVPTNGGVFITHRFTGVTQRQLGGILCFKGFSLKRKMPFFVRMICAKKIWP